MMKIRNNSNKVIGINGVVLMPDNEVAFADEVAGLPSVKAIERQGYIAIIKDAPKAKEADKPVEVIEEPVTEAPVEEEAAVEEEKAPVAKKGRKKKAE